MTAGDAVVVSVEDALGAAVEKLPVGALRRRNLVLSLIHI